MVDLQLIQSKIYEIRGQRVMQDFDLAQMYGTETKVLKQAVKRNIKRFPTDFMFELNKEEFGFLRSQFVTSNQRGGTRYMPFAFTEQGVAMLSSILNSEVAIEINISIMRAFIAVRQLIANPQPDKHSLLQKEVTKTPVCNLNSSIRHWQNCRYIRNCQTNRTALSVLSVRKKTN